MGQGNVYVEWCKQNWVSLYILITTFKRFIIHCLIIGVIFYTCYHKCYFLQKEKRPVNNSTGASLITLLVPEWLTVVGGSKLVVNDIGQLQGLPTMNTVFTVFNLISVVHLLGPENMSKNLFFFL